MERLSSVTAYVEGGREGGAPPMGIYYGLPVNTKKIKAKFYE